jgi:hypothetical protein
MLLDVQKMNEFIKTPFKKTQKCERGGQLNFKIHIPVYGNNSRTVTLKRMKFGAVKDHRQAIHRSFIRIIILFSEGFKYGDDAKI